MKYLSHYIETKQTALFDATGSFFAFNKLQLDERKQDGIRYMSLGAGMICPEATAQQLVEGLEKIHAQGIAADIAENGKAAIIRRELANHEAQITGDITATFDALDGYDISRDEVQQAYGPYYRECVKNDWF